MNKFGFDFNGCKVVNTFDNSGHFTVIMEDSKCFHSTFRIARNTRVFVSCSKYYGTDNKLNIQVVSLDEENETFTLYKGEYALIYAYYNDHYHPRLKEIIENKAEKIIYDIVNSIYAIFNSEISEYEIEENLEYIFCNGVSTPLENGSIPELLEYAINDIL